MIWVVIILSIIVILLMIFWLLPRVIKALKPLPEDLINRCPHCGQSYEGTRRYCMACGGQIWSDVIPEEES